MASQGWQPGEYLGAKDAPHVKLHTAANASHIRVMIKDDNLGLGAKIGSGVGHGECTGLDAFKDLLGRLNGKDQDAIKKEQESREDLKRAIYTERRWGSIRFVGGGFLVGDRIQHLIDGEAERVRELAAGKADSESNSSDSSDSDEELEPVVETPKKSKKRKLEEREEAPEMFAVKIKKSKKKQKSEASPENAAETTTTRGGQAFKKRSKWNRVAEAEVGDDKEVTESKMLGSEKRGGTEKRERKSKKEKKEKSKPGLDEEPAKGSKKKFKRGRKNRDLESHSESAEFATKGDTLSTLLEVDSGRSIPIMKQGRHAVRARNIAQKRLASMDVASLNQVCLSCRIHINKSLTLDRFS